MGLGDGLCERKQVQAGTSKHKHKQVQAHACRTRKAPTRVEGNRDERGRRATMYPHEKEGSKGMHVLLIENILDRDHNLS